MLPQEFIDRMQKMLGEEASSFFASYDDAPRQSLYFNPARGSRNAFVKKAPFALTPVPWEENGFYYGLQDKPGRHPYHEAGVYYIQEASAMAVPSYLEVKPGERVLDLCAAPGGKSVGLAAALRGKGLLVSNEIHPARARILSENIERMGIENAVVTNETPERLATFFGEYFDRVLVDAPCSGEGMFRKNGEACKEWSIEAVRSCAARQDAILESAAFLVRPGGRLVYSTCTFAPEEDEGSVSRLLAKYPAFRIVEAPKGFGMAPGRPDWIRDPVEGLERTIRLWPHRIGGEGHYLAVLHKDGRLTKTSVIPRLRETEKGIPKRERTAFYDFCKETLTTVPEGLFLRFGEQLYLAPEDMLSLKGLKVLRPGLHLGTTRKERFEPAHGLALSSLGLAAKRRIELSAQGQEIRAWLEGMTLSGPAAGEKGWYLVTVDGYGIGWGKLAGGILKNHYPKGLRHHGAWG